MTTYRKPGPADIGKTVEVGAVEIEGQVFWESTKLIGIWYGVSETRYHVELDGLTHVAYDARIPVTTADDELLVAADMCADHGFDLAAAILRGGVECDRVREQMIYAGMEPGDFRNACDRTHEATT